MDRFTVWVSLEEREYIRMIEEAKATKKNREYLVHLLACFWWKLSANVNVNFAWRHDLKCYDKSEHSHHSSRNEHVCITFQLTFMYIVSLCFFLCFAYLAVRTWHMALVCELWLLIRFESIEFIFIRWYSLSFALKPYGFFSDHNGFNFLFIKWVTLDQKLLFSILNGNTKNGMWPHAWVKVLLELHEL